MKRLVFTIALLSTAMQAQEKIKDSVAEKHYDLQEVTILGQPTQKGLSIPTQKLRIADLQHYNKTNVVDATKRTYALEGWTADVLLCITMGCLSMYLMMATLI